MKLKNMRDGYETPDGAYSVDSYSGFWQWTPRGFDFAQDAFPTKRDCVASLEYHINHPDQYLTSSGCVREYVEADLFY